MDEPQLGQAIGFCGVIGDAEIVFREAKSYGEARYFERAMLVMEVWEVGGKRTNSVGNLPTLCHEHFCGFPEAGNIVITGPL